MRHIIVALNPRTGCHRTLGFVRAPGETEPRFTLAPKNIQSAAQALNPQQPEAILVMDVADTEQPAPPARPTLKAI